MFMNLEYIIGSSRIFKIISLFLILILVIGTIIYIYSNKISFECIFSPCIILSLFVTSSFWVAFYFFTILTLFFSILGYAFWKIVEYFINKSI